MDDILAEYDSAKMDEDDGVSVVEDEVDSRGEELVD